MTFTKTIRPEIQIDAFRSFAAEIKRAYVVARDGGFVVTEMQTNSNGLDCQWTAKSEAEAVAALIGAGYALN